MDFWTFKQPQVIQTMYQTICFRQTGKQFYSWFGLGVGWGGVERW